MQNKLIGKQSQGSNAPRTYTKAHRKNKADSEAWLCLRFTHLALNSQGVSYQSSLGEPSAPKEPLVLKEPSVLENSPPKIAITQKQQIWQCNESAALAGIRVGMSINHALMLVPSISLIERNAELETQKITALSHWAYRFSSQVSVHNENFLLLEVGKSIKLFNNLKHLLNLIQNDLINFQVSAAMAVAQTPKAACLLSLNSYKEFNKAQNLDFHKCLSQANIALASCAITDLDTSHKIIAQLEKCGFKTLADITQIPYSELGHRFGYEFLKYLDRLWGRIADPQLTVSPPESFESSADFAEPIRNINWIKQQLERLLNDLHSFIVQRQLICRSFTWRFYHENNRLLKTVTIGLSASQNKLSTLHELSELKLESIQLDWEFSSIELTSTQLVPIQLFNDDLFDPVVDQQQLNQLIDKLSSRLGHNALFRVCQSNEHLPELRNGRQHAVQEATAPYSARSDDDPSQGTESVEILRDQPLWLLEQPQRLAQQHRQPLYEGPLNIIHGPDRITSHWWSKIQSRDYFIARQRCGRLLWVFFDRSEKSWFLHGLFA